MIIKLLTKMFGNRNNRLLRRIKHKVDMINNLESDFKILSDTELKNKTKKFKIAIKNGVKLDILLPEAFATVREASKRVLNMRHFDVQLMGGIVLHQQCIAEMQTGEGKTLTSTLPIYLNALMGYGVHVVTMNDYLAKRDAEKNTPLFEFLGLSVGLNLSGLSLENKRLAYLSDITYGTNNEYGFDYLRDNMVVNSYDRVQRKLYYALVDEVDSILIDEARTPLIISGPIEENTDIYVKINNVVPKLIAQSKYDLELCKDQGDYIIDQKNRQIHLTEQGLIKIEKIFINEKIIDHNALFYSSNYIILMHYVIESLRAHKLFIKNIDYIVKNNEILIVDEHTGRIMKGRRWSDGLHQAIEAKEQVFIQNENYTLAAITFQNYFRLYEKLSGMTGTASTESFEFYTIYRLDTVIIPTNAPMIRQDLPDLVYMTEKDKFNAIISDIQLCIKKKQPVLVGTISIEQSEIISKKLNILKIKHNVLNAKYHTKEAEIIAQAGKLGAVTIATNMAGRGTDIVLGGSLELDNINIKKSCNKNIILNLKNNWTKEHNLVLNAGGLHIIGTERHESRRIDNQLRGRSGRQGDCGSSRFYLSMQDTLMRMFISNTIINMIKQLGMKSGESIEHILVTKAISRAQKKVENRNFEIRKQLLEYDDVINEQRRVIYRHRNELIDSKNIKKIILNFLDDIFNRVLNTYISYSTFQKKWKINDLKKCLIQDFNLNLKIFNDSEIIQTYNQNNIFTKIITEIKLYYFHREMLISAPVMRKFEKILLISTLDSFWKEHLSSMDYLKKGIHLRSYAQKDPKQEYIRESFILFKSMIDSFKYEVISVLFTIPIKNLDLNYDNVLKQINLIKFRNS
ncbi:Protein translocase subunit SecA [Buchnera aphidicola (Eriosoma grossulariae)]|uniref:preprotein translocase subunit SecA n=1 Tax=Buchnera aphidicola TaxID=9 RepID=UPI003A6A9F17